MRIVQTFWTAGQDPLKYAFGWTHPEYNLMSWALSCLSLREHYDEVELYTDSAGYHILIETLKLPYTKVHVVFDDFECLPHHWALAKIKTYSMQTEPFLHVDGDIYVPKPLPQSLLEAPLVAQNREIGTSYYRKMLDRELLCYQSIQIPDFVKENIASESVSSYNMGLFGGSNIQFIHEFCKKSFQFFIENHMNDEKCSHSRANCNVFVEQIFFAALVNSTFQEVSCLHEEAVHDNGYTACEFCNLEQYDKYIFHHLLGGHKSNMQILSMLLGVVKEIYPEMYCRVLSMFPEWRYFIAEDISPSFKVKIKRYYPFDCQKELLGFLLEWRNISVEQLDGWEKQVSASNKYKCKCLGDLTQLNVYVNCNPWLKILTLPQALSSDNSERLKQYFRCGSQYPLRKVVFIPQKRGENYLDFPLTEIDSCMLDLLLKGPSTLQDIYNSLLDMFNVQSDADKKALRLILDNRKTILVNKKLICLTL